MWNALIVDDEFLIVDDIRSSVNWDRLKIGQVFTAHSVTQAREIFSQHAVHVMLCDIEMPQGSGLELLKWVKTHSPETESVFLTCHADFHYAQEAVKLGCMDYLLKPVPTGELEASLERAITKIQENTRISEASRLGQFWLKHQPIVIEHFWLDILLQNIPANPVSIQEAARSRNIPFSENARMLPVLISVQKWHDAATLQDQKILAYGMRNIADEVILDNLSTGLSLPLRGEHLLCMVFTDAAGIPEALADKCRECLALCRQHLRCDLVMHLVSPVAPWQLAETVGALSHQASISGLRRNQVCLPPFSDAPPAMPDLRDMAAWSVHLRNGLFGLVEDAATLMIHTLDDAGQLFPGADDAFRMQFLDLLRQSLPSSDLHIPEALCLPMASGSQDIREALTTWVRALMTWAGMQTPGTVKQQNPCDILRSYIRTHLDEDISRESLARLVFLHPDHVDRLFKRETGVSVTRYLQDERIRAACGLLSHSSMPVSSVALTVGYTNLSNFSTLFKRVTGVTPVDYRKLYPHHGG